MRKVIEEFNGRAILADEVGMGKTIEAGMILRKYLDRGQVKKSLILVPASLGFQWTSELVNKFKIDNIFFNRKGRGWEYFDHQIASLDKAKREEHARFLKKIDFDLVIVDEAHRLKNRETLNWKFVNSLKKKFFLLLTATPIQNNIRELYNLITLLYPDKYRDFGDFKEKYRRDQIEGGQENLQQDLESIMIRNRHQGSILEKSNRKIYNIFVDLNSDEKKLYEKMTAYIRKEYKRRRNKNLSILNLLTYQRELCSSSYALLRTLAAKKNHKPELNEIYNMAMNIKENAKIKEVERIIKEINDRIIIFTEYQATQVYIANHLERMGYKTILFNGRLSDSGKEWIKIMFQKQNDILISTEAGGQGINLQFCNTLINYDLPWNPMKIEQRIGRIHRLGQTRDVHIYNLATRNTIEVRILEILYKKICLFRDIIGDMQSLINAKSLQHNLIDIIDK